MPFRVGKRVDPRAIASIPAERGGSRVSCIFCRIVAGEIPAEIVASDDGGVAFLDLQPLADGHTLIVPRVHAPASSSTLAV